MKNEMQILKNAPLSKYTFTRTGGIADHLAFPENVPQVVRLVKLAKVWHWPLTVLGNASNLIVRDGGIAGLTLILTHMCQLNVDGNVIKAGAGVPIIDVSRCACTHALAGLEFAAGIPGSVGGAIFMNAGAYGGSAGQAVRAVRVLTPDRQLRVLTPAQLHFGYRHSVVQERPGTVVLKASFRLRAGNADRIQAAMDNFNAQRAAKQPLDRPSCGSVFRRPKGHYAGQLIHDAHLQGYRSGGAQVSRVHAGFIVNVGHATATDYLNVIHHVQHRVYQTSGIHLQTEVRVIGRSA